LRLLTEPAWWAVFGCSIFSAFRDRSFRINM
jgi:hypothetical protein